LQDIEGLLRIVEVLSAPFSKIAERTQQKLEESSKSWRIPTGLGGC